MSHLPATVGTWTRTGSTSEARRCAERRGRRYGRGVARAAEAGADRGARPGAGAGGSAARRAAGARPRGGGAARGSRAAAARATRSRNLERRRKECADPNRTSRVHGRRTSSLAPELPGCARRGEGPAARTRASRSRTRRAASRRRRRRSISASRCAEQGLRVLCIDLDPQGNLTMSQGLNPDTIERSMFDVLVHRMPIDQVIETREIDIAVASIDLAGAELALSSQIGRERALEKALAPVRDRYDFILIDTPPSLGLLTINAFIGRDGRDRAGADGVPVAARPRPAREHAADGAREPQPERLDHRDPADDVRQAAHALARGRRDPARELRRAGLQHTNPEDDPLRGGARHGGVRPGLRARAARRPSCTATWRRRCSVARNRASMREGPLAELFRATEAAQRQRRAAEEPSRPRRAADPRSRSRAPSTARREPEAQPPAADAAADARARASRPPRQPEPEPAPSARWLEPLPANPRAPRARAARARRTSR